MRVARGRIVPLGYGKYVRADRIVGIEPIEDGRGPGRRTRVWVEGVQDALVGSRSEAAILADAVEGAEEPGRADAQRRLLVELLETLDRLDPVLRRIVRDQSGWDLDRLEGRIRRALGLETEGEAHPL
jgi:hypothetical protein